MTTTGEDEVQLPSAISRLTVLMALELAAILFELPSLCTVFVAMQLPMGCVLCWRRLAL